LDVPFNPAIILNGLDRVPYSFRRGIIESLENGTDVFISGGVLEKQMNPTPPGVPPQMTLNDNRTLEGWQHEI